MGKMTNELDELKVSHSILKNAYFNLQEENERLKEELRNNSDVLIHEMGLKDEYQSDYVFEKLERQKYKQALEDIRELMHENDNIAGCEYCYGDIRYSILTKINEVIGEENG